MQVRIASSRDNAEGCLQGTMDSLTENLPTEVSLVAGNYGPESGKKLKMVSDFRRRSKRAGSPHYVVEVL